MHARVSAENIKSIFQNVSLTKTSYIEAADGMIDILSLTYNGCYFEYFSACDCIKIDNSGRVIFVYA